MAAGALVLALAGCSATRSNDAAGAVGADAATSAGSGADGSWSGEVGAEPAAPAEEATDTGGAPFGDGLNLADGDRSVITHGFVTLSTEDPVAAADEVTRMVESLGGWVEGMTMRAGSETADPYAHVVARVPSGDVGTALGRLADVGDLASVELDRTDVTLEVADLAARIRAVEMSVERMEVLLAGADSTEDLVLAEQMLTDRQSQLEQLLSQQATLSDQVSMSTLTLDIVVPHEVPEPDPEPEEREGFLGGLLTGWEAFLDFGSDVLMVLGASLPWLVFLAVVGLAVVWVARRVVRSRPPRPAAPAAYATYETYPAGPQAGAPMAAPTSAPGPVPGPVPPAPATAQAAGATPEHEPEAATAPEPEEPERRAQPTPPEQPADEASLMAPEPPRAPLGRKAPGAPSGRQGPTEPSA